MSPYALFNLSGIEELDGLLNQLDAEAENSTLDPLRKAMKTKGGAKNQARAVAQIKCADNSNGNVHCVWHAHALLKVNSHQ